MQLNQTVCVVTGAAAGLGHAVASRLAAEGARVAWLDRDAEPVRALASASAGLALSADVASANEMEAAFARLVAELGTPRVLVNCAGILGPARVFQRDRATGAITPRPLEALRRVIDVNLVGTFNAIRLFAAALHAAPAAEGGERGVIINTASIAAEEALSGQAAYGASKGGVAAMTLPLARELARYGIRAVAIAPGTFETEMYKVIPPETRRALIDDVPFPPRPGRPEEFASLVIEAIHNQMLNGSMIRIDGAVRMREPRARSQA
jgi:NAD(P)-dependent dehydrogenase (short-subunit alcohol dehydrogenase family)